MKYIPVSILTVCLLSPLAWAAETALTDMATIVIQLNHYPTAKQKESLSHMIADPATTAGEKLLAGALLRMQHRVGGDDADHLRRLSADGSAAQAERELAEILLGLAHKASGNDIKRLQSLGQ